MSDMTDYTLKTDEVRFAIVGLRMTPTQFVSASSFERWLRHIQADAWDEGHGHCFHVEDPKNPDKRNPYRIEAGE